MPRILPGTKSGAIIASLLRALRAAPNLYNESEERTTGSTAIALDTTVYQTNITTDGSAGARLANLGNGTGAIIGQRKLVTQATRTNGSDTTTLDAANIMLTSGSNAASVSLAAAGQYFLFEWTGAKWKIIYGTGTAS